MQRRGRLVPLTTAQLALATIVVGLIVSSPCILVVAIDLSQAARIGPCRNAVRMISSTSEPQGIIHLSAADEELSVIDASNASEIIELRDVNGSETVNGDALLLPEQRDYQAATLSPDGTRLFLVEVRRCFLCDSGEWYTRLCDVDNVRQIAEFQAGTPGMFSPDGTMLAMANWEPRGTVTLRDAADGSEIGLLGEPSARDAHVSAFAFSPDNKLLAFGWEPEYRTDPVIQLWDLETGTQLVKLEGFEDRIVALAFNEDGTMLASSTLNAPIRLWGVPPGN